MRSIDYLKQNGVDVDKSLELFGDMQIYNETMQDFLDGIEEKKQKLNEYKEKNDWANYAIYAHSIKSDARYLGFTEIAAKCLEHETAGKEENQHFIEKDYDNIVAKTNEMIKIVSEYLNGEDSTAAAAPAPEVKASPEVNAAPVTKENVVLVADDSSLVSNFATKMLGDSYKVLVAKDGKEVLNYISSNNYNILCLLLDLNMPVMGGFEVLDYFKENNLFASIPVSIITGEDSKEGIDKAFGYGIVDMLTKPFNQADIKRVVEKTIARKTS